MGHRVLYVDCALVHNGIGKAKFRLKLEAF